MASRYLAAGAALYDLERHRTHAFLFGQDPGVFCLGLLAWTRLMEGRLSEAQSTLEATLALAAYRADHGHYPSGLSSLCPTYLPQLPKDPFSGNDFRYVPRENDCLLYSVGANGADDGGVREDPPSNKDDISIYPQPP